MIKYLLNFIFWGFCYSTPIIVLAAATLKRMDILWITIGVFAVCCAIVGYLNPNEKITTTATFETSND